MEIIRSVLGVFAAYLVGSFPTSFIVGKLKGVDVRKKGSGNVGATNVLRTVGKLPALITLVVDILKGAAAVTIIADYFYTQGSHLGPEFYRAVLGLSVIAGHNWTVFLRFKGGKGVATSCGVFSVLLPKAMIVGLLVFILTLAIAKYVSLASIHLAITVPVVAAMTGESLEYTLFSVTICMIICYRHKGNIKRLLSGNENKIGHTKS